MRESTKALIADYENLLALMKQEDGVTEFECSAVKGKKWTNCICPTEPIWDSGYANFRVKQKPVEGWVWKYPSGMLSALYKQKQPDDITEIGRVMVLMREVTK